MHYDSLLPNPNKYSFPDEFTSIVEGVTVYFDGVDTKDIEHVGQVAMYIEWLNSTFPNYFKHLYRGGFDRDKVIADLFNSVGVYLAYTSEEATEPAAIFQLKQSGQELEVSNIINPAAYDCQEGSGLSQEQQSNFTPQLLWSFLTGTAKGKTVQGICLEENTGTIDVARRLIKSGLTVEIGEMQAAFLGGSMRSAGNFVHYYPIYYHVPA